MRLRDGFFTAFIQKDITAQTVAQVHVHYSPWCQYGFFVWISKGAKNVGNTLNALFNGHMVGGTCQSSYALACRTRSIRLVVLFELRKCGFVNALGHKLFPRLVVH